MPGRGVKSPTSNRIAKIMGVCREFALLKRLLISKHHERITPILPQMASTLKAFTANIHFFSIPAAIMSVYHIMSGKQKCNSLMYVTSIGIVRMT
jgi:hypothetical protein